MNPPHVKVSILSKSQANILLTAYKPGEITDNSGEILNNTGTMDYEEVTRTLSLKLKNMVLKKINRSDNTEEGIEEEKFSLLFQSQFNVGGEELLYHVWTLSLPVIVIADENQESHALATVTWDNAFSEDGRVLYAVPEMVSSCIL